jgi:tellurite resistance protein TehA-like permease
MSSAQGMDIRAPIGGLFTLLGLMLAGYGLVAGSRTASDVAPVTNVNLWWGLAMLAFGIFMLMLARRAMKHPAPPHAHPHPEE